MNPKTDIEEDDAQQVGSGRGNVVRVTVVMPPSMYEDIRSGADENRQLVGEYIRDILRDALDREDNWVVCSDKDCQSPVYKRYNFCPMCGEEIPEDEDEDEDEE